MITPTSKLLGTVGMFKKAQDSRSAVANSNFVVKSVEQVGKIADTLMNSVNAVVKNQDILKLQPTDAVFNKRPAAAAHAVAHSVNSLPGHHTPAKAA